MAVFQMDKNFKAVINKDAIKLVPELSVLNEKELLYTILVADYVDGPYRKKPIEERQLMASRSVFNKPKQIVETAKIRNAINAYKGLVFDVRREQIDVYNTKIKKLQKESLSPNVATRELKQIDDSIKFLMERIESIQKSLDIEELSNLELKGGRKLSMIEIWQRNMMNKKEFEEMI